MSLPMNDSNMGQGRRFLMTGLAIALAACAAPPADDANGGGTGGDDSLQLAQAASCPRPPAGTDSRAEEAYDRVNAYRQAVGLGCSPFSPQVAAAATKHSEYFAGNSGMCVASPHREVMGCNKFVAERFADRVKAAGYTGNPAYEAMTYVGSGAKAVDIWVDSVWHRIPILSPFVGDSGYGGAPKVDTMNFAWADKPSTDAPVVYPFSSQTKVPRSFDGATESPQLPVPPKGWPSGYPIMVYGSELKVTSHTLFDAAGAPVEHIFMVPEDAASMGILRNEIAMYSNEPLKANATYRVVIEGSRKGEAVHLDWSFTTR
jgi:hypothetical protein